MLNFFKKRFFSSQPVIKPIKIYDLTIPSENKGVSKKDLALLTFFLNFTPSKTNLACEIKTFSDDVFAHIYCETPSSEWNFLKADMVKFSEMLNKEETLEDFLNLFGIEEEQIHSLNEKIILTQAIECVNDMKKNFQSVCTEEDNLYFEKFSDVNYFIVIWGTDNHMNFILENLG